MISLPSTRCTPPVVAQLRDVLGTHPGMTEVQLRLLTRSSTKVLRLDDNLRVTPEPGPVRRPQAAAGARLPDRMSDVTEAAGPDGSTGSASRLLRRVLSVLALFVVGGAAGGVLWERLWDAPTGLAYQGDWYLEPAGPDVSFEGIALFVLIAFPLGLVLAVLAGLWRGHETVTVVAVLVSAGIAAAA